MRVSELIEALNVCSQDAEVVLQGASWSSPYDPERISFRQVVTCAPCGAGLVETSKTVYLSHPLVSLAEVRKAREGGG